MGRGWPFLALISIALLGCATSSPSDEVATHFEAPLKGKARIVLFRTRDSGLYVLRGAGITVDGAKTGTAPYGSFNYFDVPPRRYELGAELWDAPGACRLTLDAAAGSIYYFQVDPREESFVSFAAGDFAAGLLADQVISIAGGMTASSIESYGKECGGAFKLYPVDQDTAGSRLAGLIDAKTCCRLDDNGR